MTDGVDDGVDESQQDMWNKHLQAIDDEDKVVDGVDADLAKLKEVLAIPLPVVSTLIAALLTLHT